MMLAARGPGAASWLLSLLLHLLLALLLWWTAAPAALPPPPPLAVELWAAAPAVAPPPPPPAKLPPPAAPVVPQLADADILLQAGKPPPPRPAPLPPPPPQTNKATTMPPPAKPASSKPATGKAAPATPATDELLAELDLPSPAPGSTRVTQAGARQQGAVAAGGSSGVADARAQYVAAVRNRVRPYVMVPDGIAGNPEAVVEVTMLPTLEIRSSRLLRSSGVPAYDQAVLAALAEARRFPPLPKGADFADFRRIILTFRPKE